MDAVQLVTTLYPRLIDGDIGVLGAFCDRATADSPLCGHQQPPEFVAETRAWLDAHHARVEDVHTTATPQRIAHEFILYLTFDDAERELPVMLIADVADDCIRDLRIYHSTWPLTGAHAVRTPLLQYRLTTRPPEPVGTYHEALAEGDAEKADSVFESDGWVREPAGSAYRHAGHDRTEWYRSVLAGGPLPLHLGTVTDDGETVVYEYELDRWGGTTLPHQAGAAAYQRGSSGKLVSARIYDDVEPPGWITAQ